MYFNVAGTSGAMVLNNSGILLLGKTSATATGAGCELRSGQLIAGKTASGTVNGVFFNHNTSYVGGLNYSDTATSLVTSSDERLKENIEDNSLGLGFINELRTVTYNWKKQRTFLATCLNMLKGQTIRAWAMNMELSFMALLLKR